MKLLKQMNKWSCGPMSFAMVANSSLEDIIQCLGVSGDEVIYPDLPEPFNHRTIVFSELIKYMVLRGYAVTPLIVNYKGGPSKYPEYNSNYQLDLDFIKGQMAIFDCVISGHLPSGTGHVVAWDHSEALVYDPCGLKYEFEALKLNMEIVWLCSHYKPQTNCSKA